jgi:hypothetical protein
MVGPSEAGQSMTLGSSGRGEMMGVVVSTTVALRNSRPPRDRDNVQSRVKWLRRTLALLSLHEAPQTIGKLSN